MATPVVAGNGALARQYFREGWYNGYKNLTLGFDPSAALIKALLINSAVGMDFAGVNPAASDVDVTLELPPDTYQVGSNKGKQRNKPFFFLCWCSNGKKEMRANQYSREPKSTKDHRGDGKNSVAFGR